MANEDLYPLLLRAVAKEKVWGGRNLERLMGKRLEPGRLIGETWEAWDGCVIQNGRFQGLKLAELVKERTLETLGAGAHDGRLPLLFKFIDAQDDLSVQVHPDDLEAQRFENYPYGKTEAWYIIHAEPGAQLIHGFRQDVDSEKVKAYLERNRLQDLLAYVPVERGDVVFVPAGTVHAIMKGVVLAEIQENSDITYRLYDWGRVGQGRDLHILQSMQVAKAQAAAGHKIPRRTIHHAEFDQHFLVACRYFALELFEAHAAVRALRLYDKFNIFSVLAGTVEISSGQHRALAQQGQTILLPASLGAVDIIPSAPCQLLRAYVPDLRMDVYRPLSAAGYQTAEIEQLGGAAPRSNDLIPLLSH